MKVEEIMTRDVAACRPDDPCSEAVKLMWDNDCGIVPIVDSDRRVVGAITDRDIAIACWSRDVAPSSVRICDTMTADVKCCCPDDSVRAAEQIMEQCQVRRLPVTDNEGRLCGILSLADITRQSEEARGGKTGDVDPKKVVEAYAAVCHPRSQRLHS
ncbi:MAG TPA: CBS domain-containing protein [Candidatus Limnocylindrales bacterium]|nr:CBS domain-containing protein [Candidatus Limnocylindrales bacterium]